MEEVCFSRETFVRVVRKSAGEGWDEDRVPEQVDYLARYLNDEEIGARALWIEPRYIDRHFLASFQAYYSTALRDVPRVTTRIHVFRAGDGLSAVRSALASADPDGWDRVRDALQRRYIGFVVVRPLPFAPIGRTVLQQFPDRPSRCFGPPPPPHRVHVLGMELKASGVPFHQQDQAVGACATAAVWSALSVVMRRDGVRSPTPLAVTEAASNSVPINRVLPAVSGLTLEQMVGAVRACGFAPDVFKPSGQRVSFLMQVVTYARSGIPVVLRIHEDEAVDSHAVTVVGVREAASRDEVPDLELPVGSARVLRCRGLKRLYLHDDRTGPYAKAALVNEAPSLGRSARAELRIDLLKPGGGSPGEAAEVHSAIAPLYPKIRITAAELLSVAVEVLPTVQHVTAEAERGSLRVEPQFVRSGDYFRSLRERPISGARVLDAAENIATSRYLGVLRFETDRGWLLDVLCDATDIHRPDGPWASVLAVALSDRMARTDVRDTIVSYKRHVHVA